MVERTDLIIMCRQIGGMMEAGVDFLRITKVLRAQTDHPRLLEVYDQIDREMRMGVPLSDALSHAPDLFSPFAISLIRQGEERNTLAEAFTKVADFLQKDEETLHHLQPQPYIANGNTATVGAGESVALKSSLIIVRALDAQITRLQSTALRTLTIAAGLLLSMAAVWWSVEMGLLEKRWQNVTLACVAALFIASAGVWVRRRIESDRLRELRCSFCGQAATPDSPLEYAPLASGLAICARCADQLAGRHAGSTKTDSPQNQANATSNGIGAADNAELIRQGVERDQGVSRPFPHEAGDKNKKPPTTHEATYE